MTATDDLEMMERPGLTKAIDNDSQMVPKLRRAYT